VQINKAAENATKLMKRVYERRISKKVITGRTQFGFSLGKDDIWEYKKKLFCAFEDLKRSCR